MASNLHFRGSAFGSSAKRKSAEELCDHQEQACGSDQSGPEAEGSLGPLCLCSGMRPWRRGKTTSKNASASSAACGLAANWRTLAQAGSGQATVAAAKRHSASATSGEGVLAAARRASAPTSPAAILERGDLAAARRNRGAFEAAATRPGSKVAAPSNVEWCLAADRRALAEVGEDQATGTAVKLPMPTS